MGLEVDGVHVRCARVNRDLQLLEVVNVLNATCKQPRVRFLGLPISHFRVTIVNDFQVL